MTKTIPQRLYPGLKQSLPAIRSAYKKTTRLERTLHAILLATAVAGFVDLMLEISDYHDDTIYWAQTISGNWPGVPEALKDKNGENMLGLMGAITLNLAQLVALGAGYLKLTKLERKMNDPDMIAWYGFLLRRQLEENITEIFGKEMEPKIRGAVVKSFNMARTELTKYAKNEDGEEGKRQFVHRVDELIKQVSTPSVM